MTAADGLAASAPPVLSLPVEAVDVASLVARLRQIDREDRPGHWLWETRVMGCDVARLMRIPEVAEMVDRTEDATP